MSKVIDNVMDLKSGLEAPQRQNKYPTWFNEKRADAWEQYKTLSGPSAREENWRFSSLKKIDFSEYKLEEKEACSKGLESSKEQLLARSKGCESSVARFIFLNNELLAQEGELPSEVQCLTLQQALQECPDLLEKHLMKTEKHLGSDKFAALHASQLLAGVFLFVPEDVCVEGVIEVFHWVGGDHVMITPHTLVIAQKGAKVSVMEQFQSVGQEEGWVLSMNDLWASEGAEINYHSLQDLNLKSRAIQMNTTVVQKEGKAKSFTLNVGAQWARQEHISRLEGEDAHSDMLSLNLPHGNQEFDQRTFQHHCSRGAKSDLLYKNTLFDEAKTVFSGLISVDEGAHDTDAYQTCRNLFMSDLAEAHSMPGLEINADQVKCSHGSTSAKVSDEEIFYLQSRGITRESAIKMIAFGFSSEVIERIDDEDVENFMIEHIQSKFA